MRESRDETGEGRANQETRSNLSKLGRDGFIVLKTKLPPEVLTALRQGVFTSSEAGKRCLLDHPCVADAAATLREELALAGLLPPTAVAIQAIAFDKNPDTNWKVAWHQDLMFPFAKAVESEEYRLPCVKEGVHYARPPLAVLEQMTAVRLHLDNCDPTNGPLRVAPGSHQRGILKSEEITQSLLQSGEVVCLAAAGEVLLMKPLLLHASSQASSPRHRRVLHLVYYSGTPVSETWHRTI